MRLPEELHDAIVAQTARFPLSQLARASREVSRQYRAEKPSLGTWESEAHRFAYLLARMPATYAATARVLQELRRVLPQAEMRTLLDLGAGPGTATWAAVELLPQLQRGTLVEQDAVMLHLGRTLASTAASPLLSRATWIDADLSRTISFEPHDLVILSYALGEIAAASRTRVLEAAWAAAEILVIIEPGTPKRFAIVLDARARLIAAGAQLLAPCPHSSTCPLATQDDWCHFAARVERSSIHRRLKDADLGHEDEKFSYLIACKPSVVTNVPAPVAETRIIRRPALHSGHIQLTLCTPAGIKKQTVARSQKLAYRKARRADWGDAWPLPPAE